MIPLGTQYLVTLDAVPGPFQRVALAEIPGLRFRTDKHLTLPAHAGWILGSVLHEMGLTAVRVEISPRHRLKFQVPRDAGEVEQAISDSELRQGVPASSRRDPAFCGGPPARARPLERLLGRWPPRSTPSTPAPS